MSQTRATTLELPVKLVRRVARHAFNDQLQRVKRDVMRIAERENARRLTDNRSLFRRIGLAAMEPMLDIETVYDSWLQEYTSGKMARYHPAYEQFWRSRTWWWKRMQQFCELPEADDDRTIHMSMEDLDLIDYQIYMSKVDSRGQA